MNRVTASLVIMSMAAFMGATSSFAQKPEIATKSAVKIAKEALNAWHHENWSRAYSFLSDQDKKRTSKKAFIAKYKQLGLIEKLVGYKIIKIDRRSDNDVFIGLALKMLDSPDTKFYPTKNWYSKSAKTTWHLVRDPNNVWKLTFIPRNSSKAGDSKRI